MVKQPDWRTVAERSRWARERRGWSQRKASAEAGLTPTHVGLIEGRLGEGVGTDTIRKLATAYGVSAAWLALGEGSPDNVPRQSDLGAAAERVIGELRATDLGATTPMRALQLIERWQSLLQKAEPD